MNAMRITVLMFVILTSAMAVVAQEQDKHLTLIRKIQVDPLGTLGAVDGCEFSKDGKLVSASDNHGVCRISRSRFQGRYECTSRCTSTGKR